MNPNTTQFREKNTLSFQAFGGRSRRRVHKDIFTVCLKDSVFFSSVPLVITVGGGLPVFIDGDCAGGIGVSSGSPEQDTGLAKAGLDYCLKLNQQSIRAKNCSS